MKKLVLLLFVVPFFADAQDAVIRFSFLPSTVKQVALVNRDYSSPDILFGGGMKELTLQNGKGQQTFKLSQPIFASLYYRVIRQKSFRRILSTFHPVTIWIFQ